MLIAKMCTFRVTNVALLWSGTNAAWLYRYRASFVDAYFNYLPSHEQGEGSVEINRNYFPFFTNLFLSVCLSLPLSVPRIVKWGSSLPVMMKEDLKIKKMEQSLNRICELTVVVNSKVT